MAVAPLFHSAPSEQGHTQGVTQQQGTGQAVNSTAFLQREVL